MKRPEFIDIDNATRRPGVNSKKRETAEASQKGGMSIANAYPLGGPGPNGSFAAQPYASSQLGTTGGTTPQSFNRLGGNQDREPQ